jgi:hypothetical protein
VATVIGLARSRRSARWIALSLVLVTAGFGPLARAADSGTDQEASLTYEPKAGYDPAPRVPGRLAPAQGALMGVHSEDSTNLKPEQQGIVKLEEALGRTLDINNHYHGGWDSIAKGGLSWLEKWDVESGRIPLVGWGCYNSDRIISGAEDGVIRKTAQQMKAFGHEFFMRYCWEMDGDRKQGTVKGYEKFNEAWRRMYRLFQEEGATNVIWVWTANAAGFKDSRKYTHGEPAAPYFYPGDDYVDWIAADGYNWGVSKRNQGDRWRQVLEIFDEFMVFARAHPKPIMIGEYGAQEQKQDPGAKPFWMRHAHDTLMNKPKTADCPYCGAYSDVAAVVYFDVNYGSHGDWRIMSSQATFDAYREAAADPYFHQLHTVPWPPHANRGQPQSTEYGPRDDSAASSETSESPPPDEPPADDGSQAAPPDQADPAAPPDEQAGEPAAASQPEQQQSGEPAKQPDEQAGQPAEQADQPDQQAGQPAQQAGQPDQQAGQPAQQADQPDQQAGQPAQQADQPDQQAGPPDQRADQGDQAGGSSSPGKDDQSGKSKRSSGKSSKPDRATQPKAKRGR